MAKAGTKTNRAQEAETRLQGVEMVLGGMTHADVAEELGVHPHSVDRWVATYRAKGKAGLQWSGREGRPSLLTDKQKEKLRRILEKGPAPYGYAIGLWTLPRIAKVIEDEFGVLYSEPSSSDLVSSIGCSLIGTTLRLSACDQ